MHCDDSGGLCAAEQGVNRWGGERGWYSAERGRSAGREASEHRAVPSSSSQAARRLLRTGSDYSLPAGDDRNGAVQHSTLCAAHPSASGAPGDICVAGDMQHTHRDQVGYGLVFTRRIKGGTPRQTRTHTCCKLQKHTGAILCVKLYWRLHLLRTNGKSKSSHYTAHFSSLKMGIFILFFILN